MHHTSPELTKAMAAMAGSFIIFGFFAIVALIFTILVQWRIASKAGYSGALSLLMLIPFVNFIVLILFAFTEWPIERALREQQGPSGSPPYGGGPPTNAYVPPGGGGYAPPQTMPYLPPTTMPPAIPPEA